MPRVVPPRINFTWQEQQLGGGAWSVAVRQRSPVGCAVLALLTLACLGIGSLVMANAEGDPTVALVLLGVLALFFGYGTLCFAVNRGIVRVDQNWVAMSRGPLPQRGGVRVSTPTIAMFRPIKALTMKSGATKTVYWGIQVLCGDGSLFRLPMGNLPREQADYVCERLTAILRDVQKRCGIVPPQLPSQFQQPGF